METFCSPLLINIQGFSVAFRVKTLGTFYNHTVYLLEALRVPISIPEDIQDLEVTSVRTGKPGEHRKTYKNRLCVFFDEQSFGQENKMCSISLVMERLDDHAIVVWGSVVE